VNTLTIDVRALSDTLADFSHSWKTGEASAPRVSFESPELLWKVLTAKRWEILKAMAGAGPMSIREVARRVGRDVKAVHADTKAMLNAGLLDKDGEGKIVFPYDTVHVDFMVKAA
jgi:predicted transcriptional regulator